MIPLRWPRELETPPDAADRLDAARIRFANNRSPSATLLVAATPPERWTEHPPGAILALGAFSYCQSFDDLLSVAAVETGRYCSIAHSVHRMGVSHPSARVSTHPFSYAPDWYRDQAFYDYERPDFTADPYDNAGQGIRIGNDVWIGEGALLAGGIVIGDGAVVGARSVVTKDVPPYAVVAGAPARVKRLRFDDDTIERLLAARWWQYHFSHFAGFPMDDPKRFLDALERRAPPILPCVRVDPYKILTAERT